MSKDGKISDDELTEKLNLLAMDAIDTFAQVMQDKTAPQLIALSGCTSTVKRPRRRQQQKFF